MQSIKCQINLLRAKIGYTARTNNDDSVRAGTQPNDAAILHLGTDKCRSNGIREANSVSGQSGAASLRLER
ncbi:hypothetical protein NJB14197_35540 [Mycobacterium montefiorense]|uniref:Uncharacterized protein n=1 Tax=Mycobacterium montefiorense TaxID=154654 RepID=A0AA37UUQ6_9MYCO|nr:hypothetical protein MmonteBS_30550 [Mycobacterium montefiorense]GKU34511.1 hypothetical protein NJB14191_18570 [Mycobacterium montefiorense]GKU39132.1 hypothetical protein NJB14192_11280 [Mycobacterium montefiorense]GKU43557.1 hypothetical protein NJB14194_01900 [Mycobacterium montefiorense]GKU49897.1 hypothetical protein NJB14195_11430 [Mycobacterium montefiorense]